MGEFQTPDRAQGTINGFLVQESEVIAIGEEMYTQVRGGWIEIAVRLPFFLDPVKTINAALSGGGNLRLVGDDIVDGTPMDHMKASYEPGVLSPNSGEVALEVWISKQDSQLKQIAVEETADLGPEGHPIVGKLATGAVRAHATMKLSDSAELVSIESPVPPAKPGNMRQSHGGLFTATMLGDGRVLVAGGENESVGPMAIQSAEIYNPSSGVWSSAGNMFRPRGKHTATLLQDGRVLVAGGVSDDAAERESFGSSELYDPTTGVWTPTGSMAKPRFGHVAVLLPDGRVLAAGGWILRPGADVASTVGSAELYDPSVGTWSLVGSMAQRRALPATALLADGKVLVTGGTLFPEKGAVATAEIYDPATREWFETVSMSTGRGDTPATLLQDGRVLVAGGADDDNRPLASAEIYDPISGTWSPAAGMNEPRFGHWAIVLADGTVLVSSSWNAHQPNRAAEIYGPTSDSWAPTSEMVQVRLVSEGMLLRDGRVMAVGGADEEGHGLTSAEFYDPSSDIWTPSTEAAR